MVSPSYDPGNKYTAVWQSGFTGIAYNPKLTKREITSIDDLWDPAFAGHVGMMNDNLELGSLALLKLGIDPDNLDAGRLGEGRRGAEGPEAEGAGAAVLRPELY